MIDFDAIILDVVVLFAVSEENRRYGNSDATVLLQPNLPFALGKAEYRGKMFEFQVCEQNCLNSEYVFPVNPKFLVWLDDFESEPINTKPDWADEDNNNDFDWMHEVEAAISLRPEIMNIKKDLQQLTIQN
jgi:hypothetical protein